jgi:hypothetical protein
MPDDYTDKRNGAYDAVTSEGKEPYFRPDENGNLQQVWKKPVPLRIEREATSPLNPKTGRRSSN